MKLSLKRRDNDNLFQKQAEVVKKNEGKFYIILIFCRNNESSVWKEISIKILILLKEPIDYVIFFKLN